MGVIYNRNRKKALLFIPSGGLGPSVSADFSYSKSSFNQAEADPTPTITGTAGGTFNADAGVVFVDTGSFNSSTGQIDLSATTIDSHIITYTVDGVQSGQTVGVTAAPYSSFQMQFEVASGVSKTISIPNTVGSNYTVNWGDGATTTETGGTISHTYNDGNYSDVTNPTVSIGAADDTGPFTACRFNNAVSDTDLIDVPRWGAIEWSDMSSMFYGCSNSNFTNITASDTPDLSSGPNLASMFRSATNLQNINNINSWNLSNITVANRMFLNAEAFNENINNWDVSGISDFTGMFNNAYAFNGDISNWDVSGATNMLSMFQGALVFNQDISSWNVSNVTNMTSMFYNARLFNADISNWNVGNVTQMPSMFRNAFAFNQGINNWNVSNVTNANRMFLFATAFNGNVSDMNFTNASDLSYMFHSTLVNQNLSNWNFRVLGVNLTGFFQGVSALTSVNYTDTMVGWAVYVYKNSGPYNVQWTSTIPNLDFTRTSDNVSGQTYAVKYGSDWTSTGWTDAQDAYDYLTGAVAAWTIN